MPVVAGTQYATTTDLSQIGILAQALANVPGPALTEALQAASAVCDSYLQDQFTLPLTSWGYDLVRAACTIAAWDALTVRGYSPQSNGDQNIYKRYQDAIAWLEDVAKGTKKPSQVVDSSTPAAPSDGEAVGFAFGGGSLITSQVRGWTDRGRSGHGVVDTFNEPWW
jgi:phage gp36-like protein